jgi:hypothetical protein
VLTASLQANWFHTVDFSLIAVYPVHNFIFAAPERNSSLSSIDCLLVGTNHRVDEILFDHSQLVVECIETMGCWRLSIPKYSDVGVLVVSKGVFVKVFGSNSFQLLGFL